MQLADPAYGKAVCNHAGRAIWMQPRGRKARVGFESIEVNRARLESGKDLLHHALEVVKFDRARRMKRGLLGKCARGAERQRWTFFNFLRAPAEGGAQREEAHIADISMKVARDHRED